MKTTFCVALAFAVAAIALTVAGQYQAAIGAWWVAGLVGSVSVVWLIAWSVSEADK